jgi:hypothetical protein
MITREIKVGDRLRWTDTDSPEVFTVVQVDGNIIIDEQGERWNAEPC